MKKLLTIAISLFAFNANALDYNPYVGVNYNFSQLTNDWDANSGSVIVGTTYNDNFSTEAFFQYTPDKKDQEQFFSYGLDLIGSVPLNCDYYWELLGSVGVGIYDFWGQEENTGYGYRYGAGVQYNIDENWSVRTMAHYIDLRHLDTDHMLEFNLGVKYNF